MLTVVAVYDAGAGCFAPPMYVRSKGEAVRMFSDEVNRAESALNRHPQDYVLYHFGVFDEQDGRFDVLPNPEQLVRGNNVLKGE